MFPGIQTAALILLSGFIILGAEAQNAGLPYSEGFDALSPPSLPAAWTASTTRDPGGDFTVTASGAFSRPGCVLSTNAAVKQWLVSPVLEISDWKGLFVRWVERRSSTHDATLALDVSLAEGGPFVTAPGGMFPPTGSTEYSPRVVPLPESPAGETSLRLRWRIAGDGTGRTGTIRLDDVAVGGTPRWDLALSIPRPDPDPPRAGDEIVIRGWALNPGFEASGGATVECFTGFPGGPAAGEWTPVSSQNLGAIDPGDSALYKCRFVMPESGPVDILVVCTSARDLVAGNDSAIVRLTGAARRGSVVINEIMYDPLPGRAEYVELLNTTSGDVDIGAWRLTDRDDDTASGHLGGAGLVLGPGAYLVCSPDTTVGADYPGIPPGSRLSERLRGLSLNNGGDRLALFDGTGSVVDRLDYSPSWHTPLLDDPSGRSLEKIDPASPGGESWNWGTSPDPSGGTPGRPNLLTNTAAAGSGRGLECSPNPFSPDGDGFEDVTNVRFSLAGPTALVRVRIFDAGGRPVRTLTRSAFVADGSSVIWNGYDDGGRKAGIGIYVVVVEGVDARGEGAFVAKGAVVVAGKL